MNKNIILCSDGTGNSELKGRGTNVFKLYEAIDRFDSTTPQIAFYDDGVGTESNKYLKMITGALGIGLSRNARQLYTHLVHSYTPGDKIYVFGFSRGAYTVRTLAGFILETGILDREQFNSESELSHYVNGAYKAYRRKYKTLTSSLWRPLFGWLTRSTYGFTDLEQIRNRTHNDGKAEIQFIGVWDTVSALAVPYKVLADFIDRFIFKFKFPDNNLHENVSKACHAISIDDKRKTFHPELWNEVNDERNRIEQVWFAGVHANVGGGYPKQGLSLVAMDWMMKKAEGLKFIAQDADYFAEHANVHDKLYDSRAGLAAYYPYAPRDIYKICREHGVSPLIHESVYERSLKLTEGYAPGNLPVNMQFVSTAGEHVLVDETEKIVSKLGKDTSLLSRVSAWIRLRQWLQAVFITLTALAIYLAIKEYSVSAVSQFLAGDASAGMIVDMIKYLTYAGVLVPMLIVYGLSGIARRRIQRVYSEFWFTLNK